MTAVAQRVIQAAPHPRPEKIVPPSPPWLFTGNRKATLPEHAALIDRPMVVESNTLFIEPAAIPGAGTARAVLVGATTVSTGVVVVLALTVWLMGGQGGLPLSMIVFAAVASFLFVVLLGAAGGLYARSMVLWPLVIRQVADRVVVQCAGQKNWAAIDTLDPALTVSIVNVRRMKRGFFAGFGGRAEPDPETGWGVWLRLSHSGRSRFVLMDQHSSEESALESLLDWGRLLQIDPEVLPADFDPPRLVFVHQVPRRQVHCETIF